MWVHFLSVQRLCDRRSQRFNRFSRWCVFHSDFSIRFYQHSPLFVLGGGVFSTLLSLLYCRFCNVVSLFPALSRGGGIPGSLVFGSRISANSSRRSSFWWSPVTIGRPPFFSGHPARTRPDAIKGKMKPSISLISKCYWIRCISCYSTRYCVH